MVLHVAGGEDPFDVRSRRSRIGYEVALLVVVEPVEEQGSGRIVPDRDEESVRIDLAQLTR